jgi:hypothetical protein
MARDTWVNLQTVWRRVKVLGRSLASEDRVESEPRRPGRRRRVIPFAATVALALIGSLFASWFSSWFSRGP